MSQCIDATKGSTDSDALLALRWIGCNFVDDIIAELSTVPASGDPLDTLTQLRLEVVAAYIASSLGRDFIHSNAFNDKSGHWRQIVKLFEMTSPPKTASLTTLWTLEGAFEAILPMLKEPSLKDPWLDDLTTFRAAMVRDRRRHNPLRRVHSE